MAIVEGAKGLMWWSLGENALAAVCRSGTWCSQRIELMNQLKAVVSEIDSLEAVLLKRDVTQWGGGVASVTENTTPATSLPTSTIRTLVKHDEVTGEDYLFAYNTTPYYNANVATPSVTATFQLPEGKMSAMIEVYGEKNGNGERRTIAGGTTFSDTFGPFEAHVYVIKY
jgi:hypothetical protein